MDTHKQHIHWRTKKKPILLVILMAIVLTFMPMLGLAASGTTWSQAGYDTVSETWTPGNVVKYDEGDYIPFRANAEGYVPTGQYINFDFGYKESGSGALGFDHATNWFIGPNVPYSGSPTLYTKAEINAYALATYGKPVIDPTTQFNGADAFTIDAPVELTSGGLTIPGGYTGDTIIRYHVVPNTIGYTPGDPTAPTGTFINALMTYYGGSWAMYYEAHLAESGAPNLFDIGETVVLGAGAYSGASLHVTFDRVGEKAIPIPTQGLSNKDILVEKTWVKSDDAVPVTINLMAKNGEAGVPYVAETITLNGIIDTNTNPEYAAWHGKFVEVPIYYEVSKVQYPIIYWVEEVPVPTGFITPVYGGNANDGFTILNEKLYGSLTITKTFEEDVPASYLPDEVVIDVTGPDGYTEVVTLDADNDWTDTLVGLLPGEYSAAERNVPGWSTVDNSGPATIDADTKIINITIENEIDRGELTIIKTFEEDVPASYLPDEVVVDVTGPNDYTEVVTLDADNDWTDTLIDLLPGEYTAVERNVPGWSTVDNTGPATIEADSMKVSITIENEIDRGELTINKIFEQDVPEEFLPDEVLIDVTGPNDYAEVVTLDADNDWTDTLIDLLPGEYTAVERELPGGWSVASNSGPVTIEADSMKVSITIENEYSTGPTTWTPDITKELTGMDLEDEMFEFTINEVLEPESELTPYTETVMNDGADVPFKGIEFSEPGTYKFEISETEGTIPGITYDDLIIEVTVVVTDNGDGTLTAKATYDGGQVFSNSYEGPGSITVTKTLILLTDDPEVTVNYTFYAALFENDEDTMVRVSEVKELKVVDSANATAEFDMLDLDKTYYVFETDSDGNIIETQADGTIVTPILPDWIKITYEDAVATLSEDMMTWETTITNIFDPEDLPLLGSILVNKTVTLNGKAYASNTTFYVALFANKELTELISEVKVLKMNGASSATTEFLTDKYGNPLEVGTTYYIAETNKDGVPLTGTVKEIGFEIVIDKTMIEINEEGTTVNIVNKFVSEDFPLTGDKSNMNLWLFLAMLGAAGALAPFAFRKKEGTID